MSQRQRLILLILVLLDVVVLGSMACVVIRSFVALPAGPGPSSTATPSPEAQTGLPPTWTPTPASTPTPQSSPTPRPTTRPTETPTPWPTLTPTSTPTPTPTPTPIAPPLENPGFEEIRENDIPGWETGAFVNWTPDDEFDPGTSYAAPRFHRADNPDQRIRGSTLQIDTVAWVKLRAWVYQTVELEPGSQVQFRLQARGFVEDKAGGYILRAGIDPRGGEGCDAARWSDEQIFNQDAGVVTLESPPAVVGEEGQVTVCCFAETQYAQVYHAAFFDEAELVVFPPAPPTEPPE